MSKFDLNFICVGLCFRGLMFVCRLLTTRVVAIAGMYNNFDQYISFQHMLTLLSWQSCLSFNVKRL